MKDFPSLFNSLTVADTFADIKAAVIAIFTQLKKIKAVPYPIPRLMAFLQVISKDVNDKIVAVLRGCKLMNVTYVAFESNHPPWHCFEVRLSFV